MSSVVELEQALAAQQNAVTAAYKVLLDTMENLGVAENNRMIALQNAAEGLYEVFPFLANVNYEDDEPFDIDGDTEGALASAGMGLDESYGGAELG